MNDFIVRIKQEHDDLTDKIKTLRSFIGSEKFDSLSPDEKSLLKLQLRQMEPYAETLRRRLQFYSVIPTNEELDAQLELDLDETTDSE